MKLVVLQDNNTFIDKYYIGEPAVSYYLKDDEHKILFDVGYSNAFMKNAHSMGINLNQIKTLVISHGHNDHTGGLKHFLAKPKPELTVVAHPKSFDHKEDANGLDIGSPLPSSKLLKACHLVLTKSPTKISKNITYLGEIPASNNFEPRHAFGHTVNNNSKVPDTVADDSAIVYSGRRGLFIITGCSHSGICNIIEYAKLVCKTKQVHGVIGGFHLFENNKQLQNTINYFKENNINLLLPCHCVSLEAKIEIAKQIKIHEVGVGLELSLE